MPDQLSGRSFARSVIDPRRGPSGASTSYRQDIKMKEEVLTGKKGGSRACQTPITGKIFFHKVRPARPGSESTLFVETSS
jgi:hypothetical protein